MPRTATVSIEGQEYRWDDEEYDKPYHDPELLYELYYEEEIPSLHTIGDFFGVDGRTIKRWLEKGGYSTRSVSESHGLNTPSELRDEDWLREQYHGKRKALREIADELDVHHEHVRYYFEKYGIERRERLHAKKYYHAPCISTHPESGHEVIDGWDGEEKFHVKLHRLLALVKYDLEELKGKVVHHKNHIPWDNRPENLQLMTKSEHSSYHMNDELGYSGGGASA